MLARIPRTATVALAALTAFAWVITAVLGRDEAMALALGFIPARLSGLESPFAAIPAFLTPLSSTLVHAGLIHLLFNLLLLLWCGSAVERVLGRANLLLIYIVGAYAAAIAQWAVDPLSFTPMIGASGAVSAVIGAFALSFGRARSLSRSPRFNRLLNAMWLLAAWIVLQLAIGWLAGGQGQLLATPAHIGGFLAGLLMQRPLLLWRYRSA
ncbi:MAG: rhomboid family intramembrane serine protease [Sphingomicrobium sp.]